MVKLLCLGLFIRWDKADKDRGPLQQGQAARTWGSVTWHSHGISCNHSASRRKKTHSQGRDWHSIVQHLARQSVSITEPVPVLSVLSGIDEWALQVNFTHLFLSKNKFAMAKAFFFSLEIYCCEDLNMCWLTHFTLRMLTTVSCSQDLLINQTEDPASLFKKPWWYPVYSAISWGSHHTLFGLIRWKHEDHLQLY